METDAALVRADGVVELYAVAQVYVNFALVVHPGHTEGEDAVGFYEAFYQLGPFKFRVFVVHVFDGEENFAHGLQKFGFAGVLGLQGLHDLLGFHDKGEFFVR